MTTAGGAAAANVPAAVTGAIAGGDAAETAAEVAAEVAAERRGARGEQSGGGEAQAEYGRNEHGATLVRASDIHERASVGLWTTRRLSTGG